MGAGGLSPVWNPRIRSTHTFWRPNWTFCIYYASTSIPSLAGPSNDNKNKNTITIYLGNNKPKTNNNKQTTNTQPTTTNQRHTTNSQQTASSKQPTTNSQQPTNKRTTHNLQPTTSNNKQTTTKPTNKKWVFIIIIDYRWPNAKRHPDWTEVDWTEWSYIYLPGKKN